MCNLVALWKRYGKPGSSLVGIPRDDAEVDEQRTLELDAAYILLVEKLDPQGES
jgi:hypothetical protein